MTAQTDKPKILIALKRPLGYDDVHPDLVAEDALHPGDREWPHELVRDDGDEVVIELYRTEGYERASAKAVALEAIRSDWPSWRVVKA